MNIWGVQGTTAQRDQCAFVLCELCQKTSCVILQCIFDLVYKHAYTEEFLYDKTCIWITKTVYYKVYLIWSMK